MILRFVSSGVDLPSVEAEVGGRLRIVGASPVQMRYAVQPLDGADRQATIDAMAMCGYIFESEGDASCPLIVVGEDDGRSYRVAVRDGQISVSPIDEGATP